MILDNNKKNVQTIGDASFEEQFSIGDIGRILNILRNQMYSNPIKTVIREYASNARDAHREVGKHDVPIKVYLPDIEPLLRIRDFGPGIAPDRMVNVFLRYGSSTKRDSNEQTGGFGIGCKSAFAYSDQFTIVTFIPDESGQMIRRSYISYIDESNVGKMRLVSQAETDEPQGTEICISVKPQDVDHFIEAAKSVFKFWTPTPEFNFSVDFNLPQEILSGNDWKLYKSQCGYGSRLVIDGIEYPLNVYNVHVDGFTARTFLNNATLFFKTGDLTISASREEVQYDAKTNKAISDLANRAVEDIQQIMLDKIEAAETYWEATELFQEVVRNFSQLINIGDITWNGYKLYRGNASLEQRCVYLYHIDRNNLVSRRRSDLDLSKPIYINNTGKMLSKYARELLLTNTEVQLMSNPVSSDRSKPLSDQFVDNQLSYINVTKESLNIIYCSTITLPKITYNRVKKVEKILKKYENGHWKGESLDLSNGGVYVFKDGKDFCLEKDGKGSIGSLRPYHDFINQPIYAIPKRLLAKLPSNWTDLKTFCMDKAKIILKDLGVNKDDKLYIFNRTSLNRKNLLLSVAAKADNKFMQNLCKLVDNTSDLMDKINKIPSSILAYLEYNVNTHSAEDLVYERYPLLAALDSYSSLEYHINDIVEYVKLIDEAKPKVLTCAVA